MYDNLCVCVFIVIIKSFPTDSIFLVIPEDVPAGLAAIYGFAPPLTKESKDVYSHQDTTHTNERTNQNYLYLGKICVTPELNGNDHRFGFGFRLGNHADFQVLYEFGPQTVTKPLQASKTRSTSSRQRFVRRRPVFELLVRAGILKRSSYGFNFIEDHDDEPR